MVQTEVSVVSDLLGKVFVKVFLGLSFFNVAF